MTNVRILGEFWFKVLFFHKLFFCATPWFRKESLLYSSSWKKKIGNKKLLVAILSLMNNTRKIKMNPTLHLKSLSRRAPCHSSFLRSSQPPAPHPLASLTRRSWVTEAILRVFCPPVVVAARYQSIYFYVSFFFLFLNSEAEASLKSLSRDGTPVLFRALDGILELRGRPSRSCRSEASPGALYFDPITFFLLPRIAKKKSRRRSILRVSLLMSLEGTP